MASNLPSGTENGEGKTYFDVLPHVVLIEILSFLHGTDVDRLTPVSERLRQLAATRTAGRYVNLSRCHNSSQTWISNYLKSLSGVMVGTLDLSHNLWITASTLLRLTNHVVNLTSLDVTGCCVNEQCMHKILIKGTKLRRLAYTDRGFLFAHPSLSQIYPTRIVSDESFETIQRLTHLSITFLSCTEDLSMVHLCKNLVALRLDQHLNTSATSCSCMTESLHLGNFWNLRQFCQTSYHSHIHSKVTAYMKNMIMFLLMKGTRFIKLFGSVGDHPPLFNSGEDRTSWTSDLTHTNLPCDFWTMGDLVPPVRYFSPNLTRLHGMEDYFTKQFRNLQYLCICKAVEEVSLRILPLLAANCPHIRGLCIPEMHIHERGEAQPVAQMLGSLKKLQQLSIPPCAFDTHHQSNQSIFDTEDDIAEKMHLSSSGTQADHDSIGKGIHGLVITCAGLTELELIYPNTITYPGSIYYIPDSSSKWKDAGETVPTDETLSALASLKFLQRLTLGGVSSVRHGTGFITIFKECRQLRFLSLADFGLRGQCTWMPAFCNALKHASSLQDLRIEHNYLEISTQLQNSLQSCKKLRRLCLISEKGSLNHQPYFKDFVKSCPDLCLVFVCTKDGKALRLTIQAQLKKYREMRPSLCVVFGATDDLKPHGRTQRTLRSVQNIDLAEVVYFRHHVCSPERHDSIT